MGFFGFHPLIKNFLIQMCAKKRVKNRGLIPLLEKQVFIPAYLNNNDANWVKATPPN